MNGDEGNRVSPREIRARIEELERWRYIHDADVGARWRFNDQRWIDHEGQDHPDLETRMRTLEANHNTMLTRLLHLETSGHGWVKPVAAAVAVIASAAAGMGKAMGLW